MQALWVCKIHTFVFVFDDLGVNCVFQSNMTHRETWKLPEVQALLSLPSLDFFFKYRVIHPYPQFCFP